MDRKIVIFLPNFRPNIQPRLCQGGDHKVHHLARSGHGLQGGPAQDPRPEAEGGGGARGEVRHQGVPRDRAAVSGTAGDPGGPDQQIHQLLDMNKY